MLKALTTVISFVLSIILEIFHLIPIVKEYILIGPRSKLLTTTLFTECCGQITPKLQVIMDNTHIHNASHGFPLIDQRNNALNITTLAVKADLCLSLEF